MKAPRSEGYGPAVNDFTIDGDAPRPAWPELPWAPISHLDEARSALRSEQRIAGKARRLDTLEVHEELDAPGIYRLDVGDLSEGDASWENARAFKPVDLEDTARLLAGEQPLSLQDVRWSGEVVAVDEAASSLWIAVEPGADAPCPGVFLVMPFDFLAGLQGACERERHPVWREAMCRALGAALDGPAPPERPGAPADDAEPSVPMNRVPTLQDHIAQPWSILWGPPGTGKTYNLGHEVARLAPRERLLVVSTTNRATDAAALHIGRALAEPGQKPLAARRAAKLLGEGRIRRVGWGADIARFEQEGRIDLLDPESVASRR